MANNFNVNWALYYAFKSNGKQSGGYIRYWMVLHDIHPRRTVSFSFMRALSFFTRRKVAVFVHIPKTGGTYITSYFPNYGFVTLNHALLREALDDCHVPIGLIGTKFKPRQYHVLFSTVRNPLTFFRSYYHHVVGHGKWHNHDHYDYKASQKGFYYLMQVILDRDDKWPSRKFLYPQLFDQSGKLIVKWINKNESLDEDVSLFAQSLGYRFEKGEKKRVAPVHELSEYYSDALLEQVHKVYQREFDVFGYQERHYSSNAILLHRDVSRYTVTYDYRTDNLNLGTSLITSGSK